MFTKIKDYIKKEMAKNKEELKFLVPKIIIIGMVIITYIVTELDFSQKKANDADFTDFTILRWVLLIVTFLFGATIMLMTYLSNWKRKPKKDIEVKKNISENEINNKDTHEIKDGE